jgi:hypothetical protein
MDSPFQRADKALKGVERRKKGERTHPPKYLAQIRLINESVKNKSQIFTSKEPSLFSSGDE